MLRGGVDHDKAVEWLVEGLGQVLAYAAASGVVIGFEPEPGMFIDSLRGYEELLLRIKGEGLQLTLDVGHVHCQGELPIAEAIHRWTPRLVNVHIEDMRRRTRAPHVRRGRDRFPPIFRALADAGYSAASMWNSVATATRAPLRHAGQWNYCKRW